MLVALAVAGCARRSAGGPVRTLDRAPTEFPVHVGAEDDTARAAALGVVMAARITPSARHVVVLDFVPPFVKVFSRDGRLRAAFLRRGQGPGEAQSVGTLAVSGDSLILVGDGGGRLQIFGFDGTLRGEARVPGLAVLAAAGICGSDWLVYGPRMRGSATVLPWLHRVHFVGADSAVTTDMLEDTLRAAFIPGSVAYGMVSDGRGATVRHTLGNGRALVRWDCGTAEPRVVHREPGVQQDLPERQPDGGVRLTSRAGDSYLAGIASSDRGIVAADVVTSASPSGVRTRLTLFGGGRERTATLRGAYSIRDSRPGVGVLMSTTDPVPIVFLVPEREFLRLFDGE